MPTTLLWGTANPEGMGEGYNGIYLSGEDITSMVEQINQAHRRNEPIPVHIEHAGVGVGRVISAWEHNRTLQCVLEMNESILEGAIGTEYVRQGIVKDISLGYSVDMEHSKTGRGFKASNKRLKEISVVKKGARHKCHIHAVTGRK